MAGASDPKEELCASLVYRPGVGDVRKHSLDRDYFAGEKGQAMTRVWLHGSVEYRKADGQLYLFTNGAIEPGTVVEKSVVRQCEGLDDDVANPFIFRQGIDFTLAGADLKFGTPYLGAGATMFYASLSEGAPNVQFRVSAPNGTSSLEVEVVALTAIPAATRLTRKGAEQSFNAPFGEVYDMTDEVLNTWCAMWAGNDLEDAAQADLEPEKLDVEMLREHVARTREGSMPAVDCSKSRVIPHPVFPGYGVFATADIKDGEIIEYGLHRPIMGLNGDKCPYVFTWNPNGRRRTHEEGRNQWAQGSGASMFYNSDAEPNCRLLRLYPGWRFVLVARRPIAVGEELMHLYKSSSWRKCFVQDEYLPKVLPLEARSRTGSEVDPAEPPELDVLLNDGTRVATPSLGPKANPGAPSDDLKL